MNYIKAMCECGHERYLHKANFNYSSIPDGDKREIPCYCTGFDMTRKEVTKGILPRQFRPKICECDDFRETFDSAVSRLRDDRKNDKV